MTRLKSIQIKNIGLINHLSIDFSTGLNIITGETGAGKSMILSSLALILGERADYKLLKNSGKNGSATAVIEATSPLQLMEQEGIDAEQDEYIIRRTLTTQGKTEAMVNGTRLTVAALKNSGESLIDIHGQHDHQALLKKETHLEWLDIYLCLQAERQTLTKSYEEVLGLQKELAEKLTSLKTARERKDYLLFKLSEINSAELQEDEEQELEQNQRLLASATEIKSGGEELYQMLYGADSSTLSSLQAAAKKLAKLAEKDHWFQEYAVMMEDVAASIADCAMEVQSHASSVEADQAKLNQLDERIAVIERLKKKHGTSLDGLIKMADAAEEELASIESGDEKILELQSRIEKKKLLLETIAKALHQKRIAGISSFKQAVEKELKELNMADARLEVEIQLKPATNSQLECSIDKTTARIFRHGVGEFQFLISANIGQTPRPMAKVASGGEISRIMLALKVSIGKVQPVPILVFDEIDAGIGGKTADLVGEKLKLLSKSCQILCITHLSQIARQADSHYKVEKSSTNKETTVNIKQLSNEERVEELARMQAGREITESARKHAREMIGEQHST